MEKTIAIRMKELCEEIAQEAESLGYDSLAEKIRNWKVTPPELQSLATNMFIENVCCQSGCSCSSNA